MQVKTRGKLIAASLMMAFFSMVGPDNLLAVTTMSPNFEASETEFGAGAALDTCSGSYCARATIGSIGSGEASSANYSAEFSEITEDSEPSLEVYVEPGTSDLGQLDIDRTATRSMVLNVRSYQAGGYTLQVTGEAPSFGDYRLATPVESIASIQGSEQFGINIVANTAPDVGANPVSTAEGGGDVAVAQPKYGSPNMFAYTNGDVVARTTSQSSQIKYTISMIINVSGNTPAGHFSGDFSAVVTPVF